ncbi:MAG: UTP--glucose-1-phosphate uridylyltransferase [Clostridia bacterium]|nr:UTP--glucose-1-phosphate uridylyltransferase [Clostridia bacterium]MBR3152215.1 UTP--glucose-1-phosphate uridylyltransferase [Clostridia bacterium]MBR3152248.1 UTP--glucose-1-phosphate uridylyltransferase [Clostridia bacterium]
MADDYSKAKEILKKYNQEHLLLKYDELSKSKQKELLSQILSINFDLMKELYENANKKVDYKKSNIEPIEYIDKSKLTVSERKRYEEKGIEAIKLNKFAVVTMAGGQGTRLGHNGPKGTFDMGLDSHKSLFELLCETLKRARSEYGVVIPWYIMTSRENNEETVRFFENNKYFGYPKNAVHFFIQGELPMLDLEGKILLDENGLVKQAADGHGGTLKALGKNKILDEWKENGIEWIFVSGVDNVLVKSVDPLLIGMSIENKVLGAVKTIEKTDPEEKVGVFCRKNKKVAVMEYTEISHEMANMRDKYGALVYGDANAVFHLYNIKGLERVSNMRLPYHTAVKKAKYIDKKGKLIIPEKPNAYKFELFIFDSYEMLDDVVVLRVKREEEFAPIKNAEGVDSPETARKLYTDYWNKVAYMKKFEEWCTNPLIDSDTKEELLDIRGNDEEIKDRFYKDLDFGTAGLRGVIGAGTNRMNKYTVSKATQGLANYIIKQGTERKGVVIAYDSRNMSREFSEYAALCLNANGIKTFIFDELRPVPELSFAVRELGATAGVMITASHNPPQYNGYKVYWDDGAQIVAPRDREIIDEVNKVTDYSMVKTISREEAGKRCLYHTIGKSIDDMYNRTLKNLSINPDIIKEVEKDIKIVYTPLHGAGNKAVQRVLSDLGFTNVYVVPEQELPDGNFPTVSYPNPEEPKAYELALKLAKKVDADIILATDPDSDRLGIFVKNVKTGEYILYTGNMTALLIAEYILSQRKEKGTLPKNGAIIKTIVSSNLTDDIADFYKMKLIEVLTGFKYIGEQIRGFEKNHKHEYVFGFEESFGCLVGTHARDKDGIVAVMMLAEAAAFYKKQGLTLWDQMLNIYEKYGYYKEAQTSIVLSGAEGAEKIKELMNNLRNNPPKKFGKFKIVAIRDYDKGVRIELETGKEEKITLPKSNVLYYELENNEWCCARPSGTEPKVKFYMGVKGKNMEDAEERLANLKSEVLNIVE